MQSSLGTCNLVDDITRKCTDLDGAGQTAEGGYPHGLLTPWCSTFKDPHDSLSCFTIQCKRQYGGTEALIHPRHVMQHHTLAPAWRKSCPMFAVVAS